MSQLILRNKRAYFNYEIIEKYEAGIVLLGWEVKSIRASKVQITNSFISFHDGEAFIANMHIDHYMHVPGDNIRSRKLLLKKNEIKKIKDRASVKGLTVIPLSLKWSRRGYVKLDIALGRGKTKVDKRELIKKRETNKKLRKMIKGM